MGIVGKLQFAAHQRDDPFRDRQAKAGALVVAGVGAVALFEILEDEAAAFRGNAWAGIDDRDDHYLGLAGANVVATEALLVLRDNLADVLAAKAMMCVHGDAGLGKTLSVNASLRALAPVDACRVQFRARPTPRDIRLARPRRGNCAR